MEAASIQDWGRASPEGTREVTGAGASDFCGIYSNRISPLPQPKERPRWEFRTTSY